MTRIAAPISEQLGARVVLGGQVNGGDFALRDATLAADLLLVSRPELTLRVSPGATLPLGSVGNDLSVVPTSSGSVDPYLKADLVAGGGWLVAAGLEGRAPLYPGRDDLRQGAYGRLDLRGARRVSDRAVPWAGLSVSANAPHSSGNGDFVELAAIAGALINLGDRWASSVQARVPLAGAPGVVYPVAGGLAVSRVFGAREAEHH